VSWILHSTLRAALLKLVCPHCRTPQSRAAKPRDERYRCRKCHKLFTRREAERSMPSR
jgi:transposase-like protein